MQFLWACVVNTWLLPMLVTEPLAKIDIIGYRAFDYIVMLCAQKAAFLCVIS